MLDSFIPEIKLIFQTNIMPNSSSPDELSVWKFILEILTYILSVIIAIWTILHASTVFIREQKKNREQRKDAEKQRLREFRWRQAEMAKTVIDEMQSDPLVQNAQFMMDWEERDYQKNDNEKSVIKINRKEVRHALRGEHSTPCRSEKYDLDIYIRGCFDYYFGYMEIINHLISIELITLEDVRFPLFYYCKKMEKTLAPNYKDYLKLFENKGALELIDSILELEAVSDASA
jgi:hypothetical protein